MTNPTLEQLLADLNTARHALRDASHAFDETMVGLRTMMDGIAAANHAQGAAMDACIAASDKALSLVTGPAQ